MSALVLVFLIAQSQNENSAELMERDSYAVKRFQEVIQSSLQKEETDPQELLISLRAKRVIAERRLEILKNPKSVNPEAPPSTPQSLRAARARIDHYSKRIKELEESILDQKKMKEAKGTPRKKK